MLTWLKKFVLDILPSVAATIIGAYIVNHFIIPKSPSANQQTSIASVISDVFASKRADASTEKPSAEKPPAEKASVEKNSFEKGVAEKAAIEKTVEKAANDKAANDKSASDKSLDTASESVVAEPRKPHPAPKSAAKSAAAAPTVAAQDERKASDLARAALERLRGSNSEAAKLAKVTETAKVEPPKVETPKVESVKTPDAPRVLPVSALASAMPMQPLPPAISITSPNPDVFEQGNVAPVMRQPSLQAASRQESGFAAPHRFTPPADIPASRPLDLRAEAPAPASDRTSVTDEVVSAARSMFHAVMPR